MQATYVDHMGDDLRVVNAARVSFSKESEYLKPGDSLVNDHYHNWDDPKLKEFMTYVLEHEPKHAEPIVLYEDRPKLNAKDFKLLKYLAKHNHWTPFSHAMITMREKVPIFVARQRFKHMVGFTYNEVSRRYVEDTPEFYVPEVWRSRPEGSVKQGSGNSVIEWLCADKEGNQVRPLPYRLTGSGKTSHMYKEYLLVALKFYEELLDSNVAPEQARMVLPQSMYTEYYVTGSLAAWARAYKLRSDPHAQLEIQELAKQWDAIIRPLFPVSWKALIEWNT